MHLELFQRQYDFELDQRNALISTVNVPIVAITVLTSAASAALLDFPYQHDTRSVVFLVLSLPAFVALAFAVYSAFRSFLGYEYHKLPEATKLKTHFDQLRGWHESQGTSSEDATESATVDFGDYLEGHLAEAAEWNSKNNLARGNYVHRATAAIALALALFFPSAGIYVYSKATGNEKLYQVRLVSPTITESDQHMSKPSAPAPSPSTPAAKPSPPVPAPTVSVAKPVGPPNTVFRGGTELPIPRANANPSKK